MMNRWQTINQIPYACNIEVVNEQSQSVSTAKNIRGLLSKVMQSSIKGLSVSQYKAKPLIDLYMVRNRLSFKFTAGLADE